MIIDILNFVVRFILLVFLQIVIVNNIDLSTYVNPYIYVVIILSLPYNTKPWLVLVISFLLGMTMDTFSSMPGPHIAATVLMGYLRRFYLIFSTNKDDLSTNIVPNFSSKGPIGYMVFTLIMVFSHHFLLFFLEVFSFNQFLATLSRIFFSTLFTVLLIGLGQLLFYKVSKKDWENFYKVLFKRFTDVQAFWYSFDDITLSLIIEICLKLCASLPTKLCNLFSTIPSAAFNT